MDENKDVRQAEPQNAPQDKQPAPLSEARKTALLRYMAVLFAVAFSAGFAVADFAGTFLQGDDLGADTDEPAAALSNVEQLRRRTATCRMRSRR